MLKPRLARCAVLEFGDREAPPVTDLSDDQYLIRCTELSKLLLKKKLVPHFVQVKMTNFMYVEYIFIKAACFRNMFPTSLATLMDSWPSESVS